MPCRISSDKKRKFMLVIIGVKLEHSSSSSSSIFDDSHVTCYKLFEIYIVEAEFEKKKKKKIGFATKLNQKLEYFLVN